MAKRATWTKPVPWRWEHSSGAKVERRASGRHGWYGERPWMYFALRADGSNAGVFPTLREAKLKAGGS